MESRHPKQYITLLSHTSTNSIVKRLLSDNTREYSYSVRGSSTWSYQHERCNKGVDCVLIHDNTKL